MNKNFEAVILPLLHDSKSILRKLLPPDEARETIKQLKISRKHLRVSDELALYRITEEYVIPTLEEQITKCDSIPDWHCGTLDFIQHLKETIAKYKIENNQVISPQKKVVSALFELIQLINLDIQPAQNLHREITTCIGVIQKYGNNEQLEKLRQILSNSRSGNQTFLKNKSI